MVAVADEGKSRGFCGGVKNLRRYLGAGNSGQQLAACRFHQQNFISLGSGLESGMLWEHYES